MHKLLFNLLYGAGVYRVMDEAGEDGSDNGGSSVQIGENGEAQGTNNDARVALLNRISDGLDTNRAEELVEIDDNGAAKPFTVDAKTGEEGEDAEAKAAREAAEAEAARQAAEQEAAAAAQSAPVPKIKVNGVEMELTPELIEKAQKVAAADVYLATAAEKARQAEEAARQAALANGQPSGKSDAGAQQVEEDLALARAIQMGSEAEAVAAIQKLRSTGPSSDDVSRVVDERLTFKEAISKFNDDYSDIVGDPVLKKLALDKDAELLAAGDTRSYSDRYTAIGNELRAWVQSKAPTPAANGTTVQDQSNKEERKAAAPTPPKAAAGKQNHQQQAEKEETTQDIIADMAAKRGGPQWMMNASR